VGGLSERQGVRAQDITAAVLPPPSARVGSASARRGAFSATSTVYLGRFRSLLRGAISVLRF